MNDQQILAAIADGKLNQALDALYAHFGSVKSFVMSNSGTEEDARDVFQDALVIFCERVPQPDFQLTGTIQNYLFGICRYRWFAQLRAHKKRVASDAAASNLGDTEIEAIQAHEKREAKFNALEQAMEALGGECRKLLQWFYFKKISLKEIASKLGMKSENAAKTRKFRCLEQARKLAMEALVESEKSMI